LFFEEETNEAAFSVRERAADRPRYLLDATIASRRAITHHATQKQAPKINMAKKRNGRLASFIIADQSPNYSSWELENPVYYQIMKIAIAGVVFLIAPNTRAFTNLASSRATPRSTASSSSSSSSTSLFMAEIGDTGIAFEHVAREWRCKYSPGPSGGPGDSVSLKAVRCCHEFLAFVVIAWIVLTTGGSSTHTFARLSLRLL
jgi:hypothetical protein